MQSSDYILPDEWLTPPLGKSINTNICDYIMFAQGSTSGKQRGFFSVINVKFGGIWHIK